MKLWLVVSTHLKNIRQMGNLPQIVVNIKNIWNHHLELIATLIFFYKYVNKQIKHVHQNDTKTTLPKTN